MNDVVFDLGDVMRYIVQGRQFDFFSKFCLQTLAQTVGEDSPIRKGKVGCSFHIVEVGLTLLGMDWLRVDDRNTPFLINQSSPRCFSRNSNW